MIRKLNLTTGVFTISCVGISVESVKDGIIVEYMGSVAGVVSGFVTYSEGPVSFVTSAVSGISVGSYSVLIAEDIDSDVGVDALVGRENKPTRYF